MTNQMIHYPPEKNHPNHNRHVENNFSTMTKWSFLTSIRMEFLQTRFSNQINPKF